MQIGIQEDTMFQLGWHHFTRVLALGAVLAGVTTLAPTHELAVASTAQHAVITAPATLPLDPAAIAAPAKGCLKVEYNSPIVNARTGVVEAHGIVTSLACDKASAPSEAESRTVFVDSNTPVGSSVITPDTSLTYRGTWSPYCTFNQQLVAAWDITATDTVQAVFEGYNTSGAPVYLNGPQMSYGSGLHEYLVGSSKSSSYKWTSVAFYDTTNSWIYDYSYCQ
jgi:hypothetical protein